MSVGKKIKELREKQGLTQGQIESKTGLDRAYLSQVENEVIKKPGTDALIAIAEALRVDPNVLFEAGGYLRRKRPPGKANPARTADEIIRELQQSVGLRVPISPDPLAAGYGIDGASEYLSYWPEPGERNHTMFAAEIRGDCMEPRILPGEFVTVDTNASPRHGDIVAAAHEGELLVKIFELRDGEPWLVPLQHREPIKITEDTRILGVVRMISRRP